MSGPARGWLTLGALVAASSLWSWWAYAPDDPFLTAWRGGAVVPAVMSGLDGAWWRLITAGWLHLEVGHHIGNALAFLALARIVQRIEGSAAVIAVFGLGAIFGAALSLGINARWTVGASGGVFALLGALVAAAWRLRGRIPGRGRVAFFALCLLSLTATRLGGTDTVAHYAGLGLGFALGLAPARIHRRLAGLTLGLWIFGLAGGLTHRVSAPGCVGERPAGWRASSRRCPDGWTDGLRVLCVEEAPPGAPSPRGVHQIETSAPSRGLTLWRLDARTPSGRRVVVEGPTPRLVGPWLSCVE